MLDIDAIKSKAVQSVKNAKSRFSAFFPNAGISPETPVALEIEDISFNNAVPEVTPDSTSTPQTSNKRIPRFNWSGMTQEEAKQLYMQLNDMGIQHKNLYLLRFLPYKNNDVSQVPLLSNENMGWLATDVNVPLIQLDSDTKKAGNFTYNYVTGRQAPDITISMIENEQNDISNSIKTMEGIACNMDGTQKPPSKYCFWLDYMLFGRYQGMHEFKSVGRFLVYVSQANLELAASESGALIIPITFSQTRPFMNY